MCVVVYILSGKLQVCVSTSITRCNIGGHVHPMQSSPCFVTDHFRGPHRVTGPLHVYVCVCLCVRKMIFNEVTSTWAFGIQVHLDTA